MIFDMGKNIDKNMFSIDGWVTNKKGDIKFSHDEEPIELTGKFPKKKGRPKMEETFFYDPHKTEGDIFTGIDVTGLQRGDIITIESIQKTGYITKVIDNNTIKINWQITYKE